MDEKVRYFVSPGADVLNISAVSRSWVLVGHSLITLWSTAQAIRGNDKPSTIERPIPRIEPLHSIWPECNPCPDRDDGPTQRPTATHRAARYKSILKVVSVVEYWGPGKSRCGAEEGLVCPVGGEAAFSRGRRGQDEGSRVICMITSARSLSVVFYGVHAYLQHVQRWPWLW